VSLLQIDQLLADGDIQPRPHDVLGRAAGAAGNGRGEREAGRGAPRGVFGKGRRNSWTPYAS
jgi:hypothetical protein